MQRADNQNAYVKRILIDEFNQHWRRYGGLPVHADTDRLGVAVPDVSDEVVNRTELLRALLTLPARRRDRIVRGGIGGAAVAVAAAATGELATAALKMAWAPDTTPVPGWLSAQVRNMSAGGLQIDNYVWENCEDALVAGSGNPQVRAGVLRLVSAQAPHPGRESLTGTGHPQPPASRPGGAQGDLRLFLPQGNSRAIHEWQEKRKSRLTVSPAHRTRASPPRFPSFR